MRRPRPKKSNIPRRSVNESSGHESSVDNTTQQSTSAAVTSGYETSTSAAFTSESASQSQSQTFRSSRTFSTDAGRSKKDRSKSAPETSKAIQDRKLRRLIRSSGSIGSQDSKRSGSVRSGSIRSGSLQQGSNRWGRSRGRKRPPLVVQCKSWSVTILAIAVICAIIVALIFIIIYASSEKARRELNPADVDFGPSHFDQFCKHDSVIFNETRTAEKRNSQSGSDRSFISQGLGVPLGSYPYLVYLTVVPNGNVANQRTCTGTLIDRHHVLLAARCVATLNRTGYSRRDSDFVDARSVSLIRLGVNVGTAMTSEEMHYNIDLTALFVYIHSDFDDLIDGKFGAGTDLAIVRIKEGFELNKGVKPVCLASFKDKLPKKCIAFGYGLTDKRDANNKKILYRAPDISAYKSDECTQGEVGEHAKMLFDEYILSQNFTDQQKEIVAAERAKVLNILFNGKLCSFVMGNKQGICPGDTGGPLMCTPEGVTSNPSYQNPQSPLFNRSDPTLKQFGVIVAGVRYQTCGQLDVLSLFVSVRVYRLWLEFVALPLMTNAIALKEKEKSRFDECINNLDWDGVKKEASKTTSKPLTQNHKSQICRKLNTFMFCSEYSPKLKYCDQLYVTRFRGLSDEDLDLDLLPFFRKERCRQISKCVGGNFLGLGSDDTAKVESCLFVHLLLLVIQFSFV